MKSNRAQHVTPATTRLSDGREAVGMTGFEMGAACAKRRGEIVRAASRTAHGLSVPEMRIAREQVVIEIMLTEAVRVQKAREWMEARSKDGGFDLIVAYLRGRPGGFSVPAALRDTFESPEAYAWACTKVHEADMIGLLFDAESGVGGEPLGLQAALIAAGVVDVVDDDDADAVT